MLWHRKYLPVDICVNIETITLCLTGNWCEDTAKVVLIRYCFVNIEQSSFQHLGLEVLSVEFIPVFSNLPSTTLDEG